MKHNFDQGVDRRGTDSIKWGTYKQDVLPLWVADMDFRVPEPIRSALVRAVDHGALGYEGLSPRVQQVVANRMHRLHGWQVEPDWVVATIGVVNGFTVAARALCNPGDGVLIQTPVYHMFYTIYSGLGLTQQVAPFGFTGHGQVLTAEFDGAAFSRAFHSNGARTRMFLLCHPHNPIGRAFGREELLQMAQSCLENDAVIVSDEIHSELYLDDRVHIPVATLSKEIADRTITLIAPSKTFNTCGLFCGFAIIPNSKIRERFKIAFENSSGGVSSLGIIAAEAAFSGACDEWLAELRQYLRANRDFLLKSLGERFSHARFTVPQATFLQWIDFGAYVQAGVIHGSPFKHYLEKAKVALNDGKTFGSGFEHYVRLNFGAPRSVIDQALERMAGVVG